MISLSLHISLLTFSTVVMIQLFGNVDMKVFPMLSSESNCFKVMRFELKMGLGQGWVNNASQFPVLHTSITPATPSEVSYIILECWKHGTKRECKEILLLIRD